MKKSLVLFCFIFFLSVNAYAFDTTLINIRSKIFEESKQIKTLLTSTQDVILVNSIWDACMMTVSQIDAYFSMLGIFNTIRKEDCTEEALSYLSDWLLQIKSLNEVNIKSLNSMKSPLESKTRAHINNLADYFGEMNLQINSELNKILVLKKTAKPKKKK